MTLQACPLPYGIKPSEKVLHINSPLTLSLYLLLYPCLWKIFEETLQNSP